MTSQGIDLLLITAVSGFVVISLYATWLWLKLWFVEQILKKMREFLHGHEHNDSQSGSGCGGFLFLLLIIGLVVLFLLSMT